jgi:hypothetical protein
MNASQGVDLLRRAGVDHVVVTSRGLLMKSLRSMRKRSQCLRTAQRCTNASDHSEPNAFSSRAASSTMMKFSAAKPPRPHHPIWLVAQAGDYTTLSFSHFCGRASSDA